MRRQQVPNIPGMLGDPGCHRGRPLDTRLTCCRLWQSHTCMRHAEGVDGPDQVHAVLQRAGLPRQRSAPVCQRGESLAQRRVEALDGGQVHHPLALRAVPYLLHPCGRPLHDAALDLDHSPLLVPLDDLRDEETWPGATPWTPPLAGAHRVAEGLTRGTDGGTQPVRTTQEGAFPGTRAHSCAQAPDQGQVTVLTDLTGTPQPGVDQHRQGHPHQAALFLDTALGRLHPAEVARLLDQRLLHRLALDARPPPRMC